MLNLCIPKKKNMICGCDSNGPCTGEKSDPCKQQERGSESTDGDGTSVSAAASSTASLTSTPLQSQLMEPGFLGLSVHHFQTMLLERAFALGFNEDSTLKDIMDSVILDVSSETMCPITKKIGSSYVHSQQKYGANHVGKANFVMQSLDGYTLDDINRELRRYCYRKKLDPKRTYVWLCCLCVNQHRMIESKKLGKRALWRCPPSCALN